MINFNMMLIHQQFEKASYVIVQVKEENEYLRDRVIVVAVNYVIIDLNQT